MSVEHEFLGRLAWTLFFTVNLIFWAWVFGAFAVLPYVLAWIIWFGLTKRA